MKLLKVCLKNLKKNLDTLEIFFGLMKKAFNSNKILFLYKTKSNIFKFIEIILF